MTMVFLGGGFDGLVRKSQLITETLWHKFINRFVMIWQICTKLATFNQRMDRPPPWQQKENQNNPGTGNMITCYREAWGAKADNVTAPLCWMGPEAHCKLKLPPKPKQGYRNMWAGANVDKAVRPRGELLLLIEQQRHLLQKMKLPRMFTWKS